MTFFIDFAVLRRAKKPERGKRAGKLRPELSEFQTDGAAPRYDDDVIPELQLGLDGTVTLAQSAADTVALDGATKLRPDREAETVEAASVFEAVHRHRASGRALAPVVQPSELVIFL